MSRASFAAPLLLLPLLLPASAWACPVCGGGGPNTQAFVDTAIFLSLLPLAMMGGLALFYRQRMRDLAEVEQARLQAPSVDHPVR